MRYLLIHGARSVLFRAKDSPISSRINWLKGLVERSGMNRATVALANKNARIMWAIMTKGENFIWGGVKGGED